VDFETVVQSAVDIARPAAQAKSVELELVVDGVIGTVHGDALRLQQVANNLLTNAIKFTPTVVASRYVSSVSAIEHSSRWWIPAWVSAPRCCPSSSTGSSRPIHP